MSLESRSDQRERTTEPPPHPPPPTSPLLTLCPSPAAYLSEAAGSRAEGRGGGGGRRLTRIGREAERNLAFLCISALQERKGKGKKKKTEPALEEDKDDDAVTQEIYRRGRGKRMAWEMGGGGGLSCKARV